MSDIPAPEAVDPIVLPGATPDRLTDRIAAIALRERAFLWWWIALIPSGALTITLFVAIIYLFYTGIGVWGVTWPGMWGFAILEYVWWIAIAAGGTFISALFYLMRVEWRAAINRIAETMTMFGIACAGLMPILHLGRPYLFYWLYPYPSTMQVWPQFRSPLLWDFVCIQVYLIASGLFWYLGMLPDLAGVRDRAQTRSKQVLYGILAMGFRGSGTQWRHFKRTYAVLAAVMAPMICSVHSVVGLDFAGANTVGWHSTQYPPFFIFGAFLSGFAMVLLLIVPLRRLMRLERFITGRYLDVMCRVLLTSSLFLGYSYMMDAFTTYYSADKAEITMYNARVWTIYSLAYWGKLFCNILVPQLFWFKRIRTSPVMIILICVTVIFGMWYERYELVVMSLFRPHLPSSWGDFSGTVWDYLTLFGTVGFFVFGILLTIRVIPVISMHEVRELMEKRQ
ncbi:MAG: polysulfide reductase NrfD [Acetobacteraceae bacterium]|nr:polysulfide reductase NrfD [Acetobacteraceae bacterium]